ncbi:hypothetical protein BO94DRAFT_609132 [Aspergillus sclerotioniger CBS 115572]|uniref:LysM domain-containing protein n=1 Tax=Aspergillus sclerotioniger CBS 115572 TaxID=1450535 RepID=A0A317V9I9_9EURO|nr:hypothetical protein BO94DRAFT_609132 [Aspergillus sclerotioniger CBS 115572]PWY70846.1 hypothetical protein BO94DRAFT_609132 [Aspergillus sclerotioniger CBS 115572]
MKPFTWVLAALSLPLGQAAAYLVTPPGTPAPGSTEDCSYWIAYIEHATCELIEEVYQITAAQFEEWNPIVTEVGSGCEMLPGLYYCVQIDFIYPSTTVAASSPAATTTTSAASSSDTPLPIQTGMVSDCDEFHLVVSGDDCASIASDFGISLADFYAWNPAVGDTCASLWVDDYVCVGIVGGSSSALTTSTVVSATSATSSATGITTPSPIQTGMVSDCDDFYLIVSGDTCATIASEYDITLDEFYDWNPAVGDTCANLWVEDYVCVGTTGESASATSTTAVSTTSTTSSTGVTTPTPYETGMVDDCDAFHLVVSGDTCAAIVSDAGITLDEFYEWNPTVGDSCSGLWVDYYVCIGIE